MTYFFLSHAPDEDDLFVERFFDELTAEVRSRARVDQYREIGFLDGPRQGGPQWPADARLALNTYQTFVALCSAKYFLSVRCGRAWGIFLDRIRRHELATGTRVPALIPIVWSSDGLPPDAFHEGDGDLAPHQTPADEDLRVLIRLRSNLSAYRAFLSSLAHRVVETAHTYRLPPAPPGTGIDSADNMFDTRPRWGNAENRPQHVYFVVAAGTRQQMQAVRENLQFYGDRCEDWAPYRPAAMQPLAAHACGVAARRLLGSAVVSIDGIEDHLAMARERNEIVVLLVDAWATRLEPLRRTLHQIAGRGDTDFAVLVPASRDDPETAIHRGELRSAVLSTFLDRPRQQQDGLFQVDIETVERFDVDLGNALTAAQQRIYHGGHVFRQVSVRRPGERPVLDGP